jgi:RNA polymerase sigma factor (sigma-70 family)
MTKELELEVVKLAQSGNERAKEILIKQYDRLIWRLVSHAFYDLQVELHSQCIVRLLECINEFDPERGAKFGTYIFHQFRAIVSFHNHRRKWDSDLDPIELVEYKHELGNRPLYPLVESQRDLILDDLVDKLPEPAKRTIQLIYYNDLTMRQVAKITGVSLRTVHLRAKLGIAILKTHFAGESNMK